MSVQESDASEAKTAAISPEAATATVPVEAPEDNSPLLDHLLAVADSYQAEGSLRQAMELYFLLVEAHQHTPQAGQACQRLMDIAENYEKDGERHAARSIYERLLLNE